MGFLCGSVVAFVLATHVTSVILWVPSTLAIHRELELKKVGISVTNLKSLAVREVKKVVL